MTEHHEATVQLSGEGEGPGASQPVINLDVEFMEGLGRTMESYMAKLDELREKLGVTPEVFTGILGQLTTTTAGTYAAWNDYKQNPEQYMARQQEVLDSLANEDGMIELRDGARLAGE